jgi:hypothetical protein
MPIVISLPFAADSYVRIVSACGGSAGGAFVGIGLELTKRYFAQQSVPPPSDAYITSLWEGLWATALAEGMPQPLAANEIGEPRTLEDSYLFSLAEKTLVRLPKHRADDVLRTLCVQVFIALLSPEFKACRQSYQHTDSAGQCNRMSVDHCRDRVSGSHCEDCPFFVALSSDQHRKLLGRSFSPSGQTTWNANHSLFLPEDFRALRIFWHLHIRQPRT